MIHRDMLLFAVCLSFGSIADCDHESDKKSLQVGCSLQAYNCDCCAKTTDAQLKTRCNDSMHYTPLCMLTALGCSCCLLFLLTIGNATQTNSFPCMGLTGMALGRKKKSNGNTSLTRNACGLCTDCKHMLCVLHTLGDSGTSDFRVRMIRLQRLLTDSITT